MKISDFKPSFGDLKKRLNEYNPAQYLTKLLYNIIKINIRLKVNSVLAGMNNQGTNIDNFTNLPVLELFTKKQPIRSADLRNFLIVKCHSQTLVELNLNGF